jgi:hypothetical protein
VRLVTSAEEGSAADALPPGVFGFTGSPVTDGVRLIGFVSPAAATELAHPTSDIVTLKIYPDVDEEATAIVWIPYDRIVQHRQYAIRNAEAISLQVMSGHPVGT